MMYILGIGKIILIKKIYSVFSKIGVEVRGFYIEEFRESG